MKKILFLLFLIPFNLYAQPLIWNKEKLEWLKSSPTSPLYTAIVKQADAICKVKPVNVTDKPHCISGNKHNYESLSIYYWPNPENPYGAYIVRDGVYNPEYKQYDYPKLDAFTTYSRYLAIAFYITKDIKYYDWFCKQMDTWFIDKETCTAANFEYSQFIPGKNGNRGNGAGIIDAYNYIDIIESIRLVDWIKSIGKKRKKEIIKWFSKFSSWMMDSDIGQDCANRKNNLAIAYDITLYNMLLFTKNKKKCKNIIDNFAIKRLLKQIDEDGKQKLELSRTRAFEYSIFNLSHIIDLCLILDKQALGTEAIERIDKALLYLYQFIGNSSKFPYQESGNWHDLERRLASQINRYKIVSYNPIINNITTPTFEVDNIDKLIR